MQSFSHQKAANVTMCRNFRLEVVLANENLSFFFYYTIIFTLRLRRHQVMEFVPSIIFEIKNNVCFLLFYFTWIFYFIKAPQINIFTGHVGKKYF